MEPGGDGDKRDVRRPMNAFLIFCKRHRSIVREKNPDLDNRSVTRILGDLWANLKESEKVVYTDLAKQYKDAFMKANPDYKWHNPEKTAAAQKLAMPKPTNVKVIRNDLDVPEGSIMPGKLADPSNMGGLSLLLIAGQQSDTDISATSPKASVALETAECEHDTVSPPVNKVKWDEDSVTRSLQGEPALSKLKDNMALKSEQLGTRECMSDTSPDKSMNARSGSSLSKLTDKLETGQTNVASDESETSPGKVISVKTETKPHIGEPVWNLDGRKSEIQQKQTAQIWKSENFTKEKEPNSQSLLALAEMCEGKASQVSSPTKPLLYQAVAAPKIPPKSLLAEAFLDTCDKGDYSDILRDNSVSAKRTKGDNQFKFENNLEKMDGESEIDEKENISKLMMKDMKNSKDSDEESPMITCGKLVVNHIIDRLFSSDIATAARKAQNGHCEKTETADTCVITAETQESKAIGAIHANGVREKCMVDPQKETRQAGTKDYDCDYDEHDGVKDVPSANIDTAWSGNDTQTHQDSSSDENSVVHYKDHCEVAAVKLTPETETLESDQSESRKCCSPAPAVKEEDGYGEGEVEDAEDFQPVRKSRRRNRGQRYQELINEGIIQPSKERMAALKQDTPKEDCSEEDFQSIDSYILPETAIRRIRKRTTSESAKDKILPVDDAKRYKTGDFDLEAHIATLPACPVESMGRKRGFIRQRHHSETTHMKKTLEEAQIPVFDIKKAVSLPPHVKIPSPEKTSEPVVGSRKRKARKHSITHLLPAPPVLVSNGSEHKTNNGLSDGHLGVQKVKGQTADGNDGELGSSEEHLLKADSDSCDSVGKQQEDSRPLDCRSSKLMAEDAPGQTVCKNKFTAADNYDLESQNSDAASDGAIHKQDSSVYEGSDSQSSVQTGLGDRTSRETVSQSKTGIDYIETGVPETKHSNFTEKLESSEIAACKAFSETVGSENETSTNGNGPEQKASNYKCWKPASNLTPGDQSKAFHTGCRSEVRLDAGCTGNGKFLSSGNENQTTVDKKDTDMNFNTKVHC